MKVTIDLETMDITVDPPEHPDADEAKRVFRAFVGLLHEISENEGGDDSIHIKISVKKIEEDDPKEAA